MLSFPTLKENYDLANIVTYFSLGKSVIGIDMHAHGLPSCLISWVRARGDILKKNIHF